MRRCRAVQRTENRVRGVRGQRFERTEDREFRRQRLEKTEDRETCGAGRRRSGTQNRALGVQRTALGEDRGQKTRTLGFLSSERREAPQVRRQCLERTEDRETGRSVLRHLLGAKRRKSEDSGWR
ncbi:MAG: hypothetical protein LBD06_02685 [Candidatus Accumulibacter sp.]|nr:hypothetical protein [Accumulibacter sp.]